jgi:hypothetical protein
MGIVLHDKLYTGCAQLAGFSDVLLAGTDNGSGLGAASMTPNGTAGGTSPTGIGARIPG